MAESKIEQTQNSIEHTIIERNMESKLILKTENGKTYQIYELYENGELIYKKEYVF